MFELSKVETSAIRHRMVANLRNVDEKLATAIADGLGLAELPKRSSPAREPIMDLPGSPPLSIVGNGPESFTGRKVGALVSDGVDDALLGALVEAVEQEGATLELVAPKVEGFTTSDGKRLPAKQNIDGGPSVLYDAVAVLVSRDGADQLAGDATSKDFLSDAFAHCKFIGYAPDAAPLLVAAGVDPAADDGIVALDGPGRAPSFVARCRQLRYWDREGLVDQP